VAVYTFRDSPVFLTLGGIAREMAAVAGRPSTHFVNLDAMGATVALALGYAIGTEDHVPVVAVEGDGSFLMGLSVVTTVGHLKPRNLVVFVLDNGAYLATGGQPTASPDVDLSALVRAAGWADARDIHNRAALDEALAWVRTTPGPLLLRVYVGTVQISTDFLLDDPVVLAEDFRRGVAAQRKP
jgi:thiamine pyrophosphate-dependent acetolactate synthase large subunit-like protein